MKTHKNIIDVIFKALFIGTIGLILAIGLLLLIVFINNHPGIMLLLFGIFVICAFAVIYLIFTDQI